MTKERFLQDVILTEAHVVATPQGGLPALQPPANSRIKRTVFRGSEASDYGKQVRWQAESTYQGLVTPALFTRNQLMDSSADDYISFAENRTDILQEYFIPPEHFAEFLACLREIIPQHPCDLLNATVRDVRKDNDTVLRYADQDMFAVVLFFAMERSIEADGKMERLTQELVEAALALGGRHYLPYRLHAAPAQFARAYPQGAEFFRAKRRVDPGELFQNQFYRRYGLER